MWPKVCPGSVGRRLIRIHGHFGPTYALTLGPRRSQSRADAVADQFPLKLCDRSENSEYEATVGSGGIDSFVQADEVDTEGAELLQCKHELSQYSTAISKR